MTARIRWISILSAFLIGCSGDGDGAGENTSPVAKVSVAKPVESSRDAVADPSFVPFDQAVRLEPPDEELRPPDMTAAGKVTAKIFEQIAGKDFKGGLWDQVKLQTADGEALRHFATIRTDAGEIKIELLHEA